MSVASGKGCGTWQSMLGTRLMATKDLSRAAKPGEGTHKYASVLTTGKSKSHG